MRVNTWKKGSCDYSFIDRKSNFSPVLFITMFRKTALTIATALAMAPTATLAQATGLGFNPSIGDFRLDYRGISSSIQGTSSQVGETLGTAIGNDPSAYCADVSLGNNSTKISTTNTSSKKSYNYNRERNAGLASFYSQSAAKSQGGGGGGFDVLGIVKANGSGGSSSASSKMNSMLNKSKADAINKDRNRTYSKVGSRIASSTIVKGKDCSNVTNLLGAIETSRMDNDTNRMGILVGNETQRYDIDKRFQMGLKQIQAGQIQNVFGGGAQAMMGGMAQ